MSASAAHRETYIVRVSLEPAGPGDGADWRVRGEIEDAATREIRRFGSMDALAEALLTGIRQRVLGLTTGGPASSAPPNPMPGGQT